MPKVPAFEASWAELGERFQACLTQAWTTLTSRGLPVGAVVSNGAAIVAVGRNRVYDAAGGFSPLQRTPIAHAEMNAIAAVPDGVDLTGCEIWTTHAPCPMCAAAIALSEIPVVHHLAADPSGDDTIVPRDGRNGIWAVIANAFFLHNVAWVGGLDNPLLRRSERHEPEITALALSLLSEKALIEMLDHDGVEPVLARHWDRFRGVTRQRAKRLDV